MARRGLTIIILSAFLLFTVLVSIKHHHSRELSTETKDNITSFINKSGQITLASDKGYLAARLEPMYLKGVKVSLFSARREAGAVRRSIVRPIRTVHLWKRSSSVTGGK